MRILKVSLHALLLQLFWNRAAQEDRVNLGLCTADLQADELELALFQSASRPN
jgi:hypothetical protein